MRGYVKLYRQILNSNMYRQLNSKQRDVLFTCLLLANHEKNQWEWGDQICVCNPGEFITSLQSIASYCGKDVKVQSVRTALLKLEKWGFLTNTSTKTGRLIKIVKWEQYQSSENRTNKAGNKQATKHQRRNNKALTTNKNGKNVKNDKKKDIRQLGLEVLEKFNQVFGTKYQSPRSIQSNLAYWLEVYSLEDIFEAIERGKNNHYWKDKLTPDILLRRKNPRGEECDRIAELKNYLPEVKKEKYKKMTEHVSHPPVENEISDKERLKVREMISDFKKSNFGIKKQK